MKPKRWKGGTDISENTPPQDELSFRNSPRTRRSSLLDNSVSSPVLQRKIASKVAMKKPKPTITNSVRKLIEDSINTSPASPIIGRRRPTLAKRLAISTFESFITTPNEESVSLGPNKENADSITNAKENLLVTTPLLSRKSTGNLISSPLSEKINFQNRIQNAVQNKVPVKRKARNNQPNLDKENLILNPDDIAEIPVKRTRRAKAVTEIVSQESLSNHEEIADLVKRKTRGKKAQNNKENKVEEIANVNENVTSQQKIVPKTRKGKKRDNEENKNEQTKESSDKSVSESKEANVSNLKGKKGAYSRKNNIKIVKSKEIRDTNIEQLEKSATPIAPRRGRRAAALEIKNTEKQTKIDSFLLNQSLQKDAATSKINKKYNQSTIDNKENKTKPSYLDVKQSISGDVTQSPKGIDKSKKKIAQTPSTSGSKDVFELSFGVGSDENTNKKKTKRNTKPELKKEKPKSQLTPTLNVTEPSWQKPISHSRAKNSTPHYKMNKSVSSSVSNVKNSISGDVTQVPKGIDKSKNKIAQTPSTSGSNLNKQKLPVWASVAKEKSKPGTPGSRKSFRRSVGSGHKDVFEFSFDVGTDENINNKKKKRITKPRAKKEKPKSQMKPMLLVTDPSWQKPLSHSRAKNSTPQYKMKNSVTSSVSKTITKREALAAKIREKKQTIEKSTTLSQESNTTSGYSSQTSKQFTSQEASYIKEKIVPGNNFRGFSVKTPPKKQGIPEINFDDHDDDGCDIHTNDFDDCETEEVVERLEFETTSSFRPPQNSIISDSVLPTPDVSRFYSNFLVGASTPMTDHVKSSNIFRDPKQPKTVIASTPMTNHVKSTSIFRDSELPKTVVASTPMTNHVKSTSIFRDPEPPKTVVEDMQQCFGFDDDEAEHNQIDLSPVRNSFAHPSIISNFEVTGMTVTEEDIQPSRFDFASMNKGNRSNVSASMYKGNRSNVSAMVTHGHSLASVSTSKSIPNSRIIQKNVSKQKITSEKTPTPAASIKNYISSSKKSSPSTKSNKISEETFPKHIEADHQLENALDQSVLFDEEPLEEAVISKPQKQISSKSQNKVVIISEVPSPAKSFSMPARKSYDRQSLNESRSRFLKMYSGADASTFGDNEDEEPKKSKKKKTTAKSKKVNKGKKATLKSGKEKSPKKVLAKRACTNIRKVNFDSSADSSFDTSQNDKKLKKSKKDSKRDKSVEDWASDLNSHFSDVENMELVVG